MGRYSEAQASLEEAIAIKPSFPESHYLLGCTYSDMAARESSPSVGLSLSSKAIAAHKKAISLRPSFADAYVGIGVACVWKAVITKDRRYYADAIAAYRKAVTLDSSHADAHAKMGLVYALQGRRSEALTSLRRAAELDPSGEVGRRARMAMEGLKQGR